MPLLETRAAFLRARVSATSRVTSLQVVSVGITLCGKSVREGSVVPRGSEREAGRAVNARSGVGARALATRALSRTCRQPWQSPERPSPPCTDPSFPTSHPCSAGGRSLFPAAAEPGSPPCAPRRRFPAKCPDTPFRSSGWHRRGGCS